MKKIITMLVVLSLVSATMFACGEAGTTEDTTAEDTTAEDTTAEDTTAEDTTAEEVPADDGLMSYEEFVAAAIDDEIVVETYVQGKQSWWDNKGTFYTQNEEGAYFLYEMPCTEDEYNALEIGTKIKVTGFKAEWDGELELMNATYEIIEGDTYVAEPLDVTELLGTDELINHMNKLVSFTDMTVTAVEYKNGTPGDDIYVTLSKDGADYSFCVEVYLTGTDSEVYTTVGELAVDDVVDVEGFLYWYNGANPHITSIVKK